MNGYKRVLLCLLVLALMIPALASCKSEEEKLWETEIGTCAGQKVYYDELRYVTMTYKDMFTAEYGVNWDDPAEAEQYLAELERTVWDMMLNNYAVLAACSVYMPEVPLDDKSIEEAVDADIEGYIASYGSEEAFREAMRKLYMTERFVRFNLTVAQIENELFYVLTDDLGLIMDDLNTFEGWLGEDNCVYVNHVYISNDPGDSVEDNRALAEETRRQLASGEKTLSEIINSRVNEDMTNTAPYYIVRDVYVEEMETAAFALGEVGAVSEVVEVEGGFYILVRQEDSEAILKQKSAALLNSYQWAKVEEEVKKYRSTIQIELNDFGKTVDLVAMK